MTVDLIQVARLQSQGFFMKAYGGRERQLTTYPLDEGGGEPRAWQSAYQLCGPHLSKRHILFPLPEESKKQSKCLQLFLAKPLPQTAGSCEMGWATRKHKHDPQKSSNLPASRVPKKPFHLEGAVSTPFIFMAPWLQGHSGLGAVVTSVASGEYRQSTFRTMPSFLRF